MNQVNSSKFFKELEESLEYQVESAKLEFALELKRLMDREGLNKAQLAERLEVSRPMVTKLLRGDTNVTIETMVKTCHSLGGKLFVRIVRSGCSARLFEIARNEMIRAHEAPQRHAREAKNPPHIDDSWNFAANDLNSDDANEAKPLAA